MKKYIFVIILLMPFIGLADNMQKINFSEICASGSINSSLSAEIRRGMMLAINEVNANKIVSGRLFNIINKDVTPQLLVSNFTNIDYKPISFLGMIKPNELRSLEPLLKRGELNLFGLFLGDTKFSAKNIFHLKISYTTEQNNWIKSIANDYKAKKIVLLAESQEFITNDFPKIEAALKAQNIDVVVKIIPSSNTLAIKASMVKIKNTPFDIFLVINSYNKSSKFINMARRLGFNMPIVFVRQEKGNKNIMKSHIIPSPYDTHIKLVNDYNNALNIIDKKPRTRLPVNSFDAKRWPTLAGLTGYIIAKSALYITDKIEGDLNSKNFGATARRLRKISIGGVTVEIRESFNEAHDDFFKTITQEYESDLHN